MTGTSNIMMASVTNVVLDVTIARTIILAQLVKNPSFLQMDTVSIHQLAHLVW